LTITRKGGSMEAHISQLWGSSWKTKQLHHVNLLPKFLRTPSVTCTIETCIAQPHISSFSFSDTRTVLPQPPLLDQHLLFLPSKYVKPHSSLPQELIWLQ
jgi:hypothetical protein